MLENQKLMLRLFSLMSAVTLVTFAALVEIYRLLF